MPRFRRASRDEDGLPAGASVRDLIPMMAMQILFGFVLCFITAVPVILVLGVVQIFAHQDPQSWLEHSITQHPSITLLCGWALLNALGMAAWQLLDAPRDEAIVARARAFRESREAGHEPQD